MRECGLKSLVLAVLAGYDLSLPVRECGLKYQRTHTVLAAPEVTPRAGVWIEIEKGKPMEKTEFVTPRAGVWIEIRPRSFPPCRPVSSLPVRECGLKYFPECWPRAVPQTLPVRECGLK